MYVHMYGPMMTLHIVWRRHESEPNSECGALHHWARRFLARRLSDYHISLWFHLFFRFPLPLEEATLQGKQGGILECRSKIGEREVCDCDTKWNLSTSEKLTQYKMTATTMMTAMDPTITTTMTMMRRVELLESLDDELGALMESFAWGREGGDVTHAHTQWHE